MKGELKWFSTSWWLFFDEMGRDIPSSSHFKQHVPNGDDVADGASEYEEMEDAVHVASFVETVEGSASDVAHAFGDNPDDGCGAHIVNERFEGHKDAETHRHKADGLQVAVFLEADKTGNGACQCACPNKYEKPPSPEAVLAKCDEGDGRVGACDVPVDGGMVPFSQAFLPLAAAWQRMIDGGTDIGTKHAKHIEDDANSCPSAFSSAKKEEHHPHYHAQQDACGVRPSVDVFLLACVSDGHDEVNRRV